MHKEKKWETVLAIVIGLVALYWVRRAGVFLLCAFVIGTAALLAPAFAQGIHWFWTKLSGILGGISGKILLTVVYIFVLIPLSVAARLSGKLAIRRKPGGKTYFTERNHTYTKEDILHPW